MEKIPDFRINCFFGNRPCLCQRPQFAEYIHHESGKTIMIGQNRTSLPLCGGIPAGNILKYKSEDILSVGLSICPISRQWLTESADDLPITIGSPNPKSAIAHIDNQPLFKVEHGHLYTYNPQTRKWVIKK